MHSWSYNQPTHTFVSHADTNRYKHVCIQQRCLAFVLLVVLVNEVDACIGWFVYVCVACFQKRCIKRRDPKDDHMKSIFAVIFLQIFFCAFCFVQKTTNTRKVHTTLCTSTANTKPVFLSFLSIASCC